MPVISNTVFIHPIPEIVRGYPFQFSEVPLISHELLLRLLEFYQNRSILLKRSSSEDALRVG